MTTPPAPDSASTRPARRFATARAAQLTLDLACLLAAYLFAHLLRFDFAVPDEETSYALQRLPFVLALQLVVAGRFGIYRFVWRYIGLREIGPFVRAAVLSTLPLLALRLVLPAELHVWRMPISVALLDGLLAFGALLAVRVFRRIVFERFEARTLAPSAPSGSARAVLLVGAGRAGLLAAREIDGRPDMGLAVIGFVDDDRNKLGAVIQGVRVLGPTDDIPQLVRELGIDHVIITIARASRSEIRRIIQICESVPIPVRIIPGLYEILGGRVEVSRIRDVEIEDLLGRDPVHLDVEGLAQFLGGQVVMVTGAGGSIGSELCRQISRFAPAKLLLVERSEPALFQIDRELRALDLDAGVQIVPIVADICDTRRMEGVFATHRPAIVLHAAAHKHVPLMEANASEAVKNNVLGTYHLAQLAGASGVDVFVQISTDKAVRPTSVMGATKRAAELALQYLDREHPTRFVAVRFGNVLGSAGSVIPIFREQIRQGGPVTVTHPDMIRYFMTIPEAAQLVLQAGAMGEGGEIFVLDMGEPVRIVDLARDMIRLSGFRPDEEIAIRFTGVRPGEKLYEELASDAEGLTKTRHAKIFIGRIPTLASETIESGLGALRLAVSIGGDVQARDALAALVPEATLARPATAVTPSVDRSEDAGALEPASTAS